MRVNVTGSGYIGDEERVGCKTSPTQRRTETFKCTARGKEDHVWFGYGAGTFLPSSFTQRSLFFWAQKHLDSVYLPKPDFSSRFYCCARNDPQGSCRTQWCKLSLADFFSLFLKAALI